MRAAVVQFAPVFMESAQNSQFIADKVRELAAAGVQLAVFPEAAITGICFESAAQAEAAAVSAEGPELEKIASACQCSYCVVGFAERLDGNLYNSAALIGPEGLIGVYRKTHLPCLGLDRFVRPGGEYPVFDTQIGKIGIVICFDVRFPESVRTLSLKGAEVICVPTNWPETADVSSDIICPARAAENHVFVLASNRVGDENGFRFIGKSKIIAPGGVVLAAADSDEVIDLCANIDPALARNKKVVKRPGEYEMDYFGARRPELYEEITRPMQTGR